MDIVDNKKYDAGSDDLIHLDEEETPIPFNDSDKPSSAAKDQGSISHKPLHLGSTLPKSNMNANLAKSSNLSSGERISGVKTFFTKLHSGSITFQDDQIGQWLKNNPGVNVKRTNMATGMVKGKTTEPSVLITIWY